MANLSAPNAFRDQMAAKHAEMTAMPQTRPESLSVVVDDIRKLVASIGEHLMVPLPGGDGEAVKSSGLSNHVAGSVGDLRTCAIQLQHIDAEIVQVLIMLGVIQP